MRSKGWISSMTSGDHNNRTRDEIIANILTAINDYRDIKVTRLMFVAGLSHTQLKKYLQELSNIGLIICDTSGGRLVSPSITDHKKSQGGRRGDTYHITSKGLQYLQLASEMKQRIGLDLF